MLFQGDANQIIPLSIPIRAPYHTNPINLNTWRKGSNNQSFDHCHCCFLRICQGVKTGTNSLIFNAESADLGKGSSKMRSTNGLLVVVMNADSHLRTCKSTLQQHHQLTVGLTMHEPFLQGLSSIKLQNIWASPCNAPTLWDNSTKHYQVSMAKHGSCPQVFDPWEMYLQRFPNLKADYPKKLWFVDLGNSEIKQHSTFHLVYYSLLMGLTVSINQCSKGIKTSLLLVLRFLNIWAKVRHRNDRQSYQLACNMNAKVVLRCICWPFLVCTVVTQITSVFKEAQTLPSNIQELYEEKTQNWMNKLQRWHDDIATFASYPFHPSAISSLPFQPFQLCLSSRLSLTSRHSAQPSGCMWTSTLHFHLIFWKKSPGNYFFVE